MPHPLEAPRRVQMAFARTPRSRQWRFTTKVPTHLILDWGQPSRTPVGGGTPGKPGSPYRKSYPLMNQVESLDYDLFESDVHIEYEIEESAVAVHEPGGTTVDTARGGPSLSWSAQHGIWRGITYGTRQLTELLLLTH